MDMKTKTVICTVCPKGCTIEVKTDQDGNISQVTGFTCERGKKYAVSEISDPRRILTSTVRCGENMLSVKSNAPIRKDKLIECMKIISENKTTPPVKIGDVVIKDIDGEGTDIIATKNIYE